MLFDKSEYEERIGRAESPVQLVVITYELLLHYIEQAEKAFTNNNGELFSSCSYKALDCISELVGSLDMRHIISHELKDLYIYANGLITKAMAVLNADYLAEAYKIVNELYSGFKTVEREVVSNMDFCKKPQFEYNI